MDGSFLIIVHKAAIAFDIGTEDGREFAFKTFICHCGTPFFKVSNRWTQYVECQKERKTQMRTGFDSVFEEPLQVSWNRRIRN